MPILHTEAITLRRRRGREADALVTLFTKGAGKILVSTRGVRKSTSRYAGVTQPFNHLNVILYAKVRDQEIWTLTQASLMEAFDAIQNDLKRMAWASAWRNGSKPSAAIRINLAVTRTAAGASELEPA